jgi:hypothetical protein
MNPLSWSVIAGDLQAMNSSSDHPPDASGSFMITDNPSPDMRHDEFFKWVGICIKEWAKIERELFDLCSIVLNADIKHVAIIYYRTPSIEGRISLTDDLLKTLWQKQPGQHETTELRNWKEIRNVIRSLIPVRNLIAHAPINYNISVEVEVDQSGSGAPSGVRSQKSWIEIATSPQEMLKTGKRLSIRDSDGDVNMQTHFRDIHAIWNRLLIYRQALQQIRPAESSQHNPPHPLG